ncbi:MAG: hypothetical protein U0821_18895 [Chloroflexota bacterium]
MLAAAVVSLVAAAGGFLGGLPAGPAASKAGRVYIIAIDVQFALGIATWLYKGWYSSPGFFRLEHPTIMLLALVIAHIGVARARRQSSGRAACAWVAVATLVSLIFVVVGIPGVVRPG